MVIVYDVTTNVFYKYLHIYILVMMYMLYVALFRNYSPGGQMSKLTDMIDKRMKIIDELRTEVYSADYLSVESIDTLLYVLSNGRYDDIKTFMAYDDISDELKEVYYINIRNLQSAECDLARYLKSLKCGE